MYIFYSRSPTISRFDMSCAQAHWVGSNRSSDLGHQ